MEPLSLIAVAVIVAAIAVAASGRFMAVGTLALANVAVYMMDFFGPRIVVTTASGTGTVSAVKWELGLHGDTLAAADPLALLQLLTHMFVHANILHLLGNLIILLAFAMPFEERIGHRPFVVLYLLSGLAAAFAQSAVAWGEPIWMIGASGAVFGIIGAFAGAYPNLVLPLPLPLLYIMIFVRMRVVIAAAVFGILQVVLQYVSGPDDNTAYVAHLGGLLAGLLLAWTYVRRRRKDVGEQVKQQMDLAHLAQFAKDDPTQQAHRRLYQSLGEPDVLEAWMERFFESARCPRCDHPVALRRNEVVCSHGHRFDVRAAPG